MSSAGTETINVKFSQTIILSIFSLLSVLILMITISQGWVACWKEMRPVVPCSRSNINVSFSFVFMMFFWGLLFDFSSFSCHGSIMQDSGFLYDDCNKLIEVGMFAKSFSMSQSIVVTLRVGLIPDTLYNVRTILLCN